MEGRGWPGCAYPFLISPDGTVYKCWPLQTKSYCVKGGNTPTLCVCLIGMFHSLPRQANPDVLLFEAADEEERKYVDFVQWADRGGFRLASESPGPPPAPQWEAAVELSRLLVRAYRLKEVWGHRQVPTNPPQTTACPGKFVDLVGFREAVFAK